MNEDARCRSGTRGRRPAPVLVSLSIAAAVLVLAGCGQRGPLYLPDKPQQKKNLAADDAAADDAAADDAAAAVRR